MVVAGVFGTTVVGACVPEGYPVCEASGMSSACDRVDNG